MIVSMSFFINHTCTYFWTTSNNVLISILATWGHSRVFNMGYKQGWSQILLDILGHKAYYGCKFVKLWMFLLYKVRGATFQLMRSKNTNLIASFSESDDFSMTLPNFSENYMNFSEII